MKRVGHAVAGTAVLLLTSLGIASGQEKPPSAGQPMPHGGMMMGPGRGMAAAPAVCSIHGCPSNPSIFPMS